MFSVATYRLSTGYKAEELSSEAFFTDPANNEEVLFKLRHAIQRNEKQFYCGFCGKELKICGGGEGINKQRLHFRHKYKNLHDYCRYIDEDSKTRREIELRKYANKEEGKLHRTLKLTIANSLETNYGADIRIEQYIRDQQNPREYRKPDIRAIFPDKDVVVEVQITSTFLDVILGRRDFYVEHNMYLLWVVNEFKPELFHQKDILYSSKDNAFVFDSVACDKTKTEGKLYLKCYHKNYYCNTKGDILQRPDFSCELITFDDLIFNPEDHSVYYFDIEENRKQCEAEQKVIKERIRKEEAQRQIRLEAIRIEQEKKEKERQRLWQIEQEKWLEEEERRLREEEEKRKKEEAERQERERLNNIKKQQQTKIEDCVCRESISIDNFWQYYQQLNDEERRFADTEIHNIILKSVYHHYAYYENRYSYKYDKNITKLYYFLLTNKYPYDWEQFKNIPEAYFKRSYDELNMTLYEYITLNLYGNHNYHLPEKEVYLSKIIRRFDNIIEESKSREKYYDYAASFKDIEMIILCYERVYVSPFGKDKDVYKLVYEKRETIRHLFSIYLGELVGKDSHKDSNYYPFYDELVSPYYHLYETLTQRRNMIFHNHGLVPNLVISLTEIKKKVANNGINPNYDLDALMPIIFPDIQWALQQTLF